MKLLLAALLLSGTLLAQEPPDERAQLKAEEKTAVEAVKNDPALTRSQKKKMVKDLRAKYGLRRNRIPLKRQRAVSAPSDPKVP